MNCRECGAKMYIDDRDKNFPGNEDIYWNCPDCATSCIEEIRFHQKFRENWHSEKDGVKDVVLKFKIRTDRDGRQKP